MNTNAYDHNPRWWSAEEQSAWERVKEALRRDWDQTRHDLGLESGQDLHQDAIDTFGHATGAQPLPPPHVANGEPDYAPDAYPMRFGYSAGISPLHQHHTGWNLVLEAQLRDEWTLLHVDESWESARDEVRYAFERARAAH